MNVKPVAYFCFVLLEGEMSADRVCQQLRGRYCEGRRMLSIQWNNSFKWCLISPDKCRQRSLPENSLLFLHSSLVLQFCSPALSTQSFFLDAPLRCCHLQPFSGGRWATGIDPSVLLVLAQEQCRLVQIQPAQWWVFLNLGRKKVYWFLTFPGRTQQFL